MLDHAREHQPVKRRLLARELYVLPPDRQELRVRVMRVRGVSRFQPAGKLAKAYGVSDLQIGLLWAFS